MSVVSTEFMDCAVGWTNKKECDDEKLFVNFIFFSAFHVAAFLPILSRCFSNTHRVVVLMRFTGFIVNEIAQTSLRNNQHGCDSIPKCCDITSRFVTTAKDCPGSWTDKCIHGTFAAYIVIILVQWSIAFACQT